jgi:hypothetical protein
MTRNRVEALKEEEEEEIYIYRGRERERERTCVCKLMGTPTYWPINVSPLASLLCWYLLNAKK